jgi:tyrosine decarboxylase / aspartate 1-decarboxylase
MYWNKLSHSELQEIILNALDKNLRYGQDPVLGLPATWLDTEEFYQHAPFLDDAPYLKSFIANPNHIGCHTLGTSESAFKGTQAIEVDLIDICAREIFAAEEGAYDGYVASGGTEANIEAMWIMRNYYKQIKGAITSEIALVYSEDSHYSMPKGADLLGLHNIVLPVHEATRAIDLACMASLLQEAEVAGYKYFIVVMNMSTTMFGSVDDIEAVTQVLDVLKLTYKIHVDGAFGGFIYPFACGENPYTFRNPHIMSFTLDAHKMLQAPYGTGIFLVRKGMIGYVCTADAKYVKGKDYTLVGSRSGANAIAAWMILRTYGSEGWRRKINRFISITDDLCRKLDERNIPYYRNPAINIVAIRAGYIPEEVARNYTLVPDNHEADAKWWKIVVMDHVKQEMLDSFINDLDMDMVGV